MTSMSNTTKNCSTIAGSYDKNGLPEDFADFAETVMKAVAETVGEWVARQDAALRNA